MNTRKLLYCVVRSLLESQAKFDVQCGNQPRRTSKAYIDMYAREYAREQIIDNRTMCHE